MKSGNKYEFVIIGSGAGGATVARELAKRGKQVLVLEKGVRENKLGSLSDCFRYYDLHKFTKMPLKSKEGVILWRAFMAGGPTVVCCANGVPCLERELAEYGVDIKAEIAEVTEELGIANYDERRLSQGSKKLLEASKELGYRFEPMPKFIDITKCNRCGNCQYGCSNGAKWTAVDYLDDAASNGAEMRYKTSVHAVITENGKVKGVSVSGPNGHAEIPADTVVLAAGGFGTPVILQKSGFSEAGSGFFMDLFVNTYGTNNEYSQTNEPTMALVDHEFRDSKGFIISPFLHQLAMVRFIEMGIRGMLMPANRTLGFMTKIVDESTGCVYPDGTFSKAITKRDRARLDEGSRISKEILIKAGVDSKSIVVSKVQGAHPGGTASVGKIVDNNLQTSVDNLFVCDASVLPTSPGLPPIMTIIALGKRLARTLAP